MMMIIIHYLCTRGPGVSCSSLWENSGGQLSGAPGMASLDGGDSGLMSVVLHGTRNTKC